MAESSFNALKRTLESVGLCKEQRDYREWQAKFRQAVGFHSQELLKILDGEPCPVGTDPDAVAATATWEGRNNQLYSLVYFSTTGSANITTRPFQAKSGGEMGDGAAAWAALKARFDGNTKESRRVCKTQLHAAKLRPGQNVIDFLANMDDLKLRLDDMGEPTTDESYEDLVLSALTHSTEYRFLQDMHYRSPFPDVEALKKTATNYFIDAQSRKSSGPAVVGRGAAMAATSTDQCHNCKAYGHFQRDCPAPAKKIRPKTGKSSWKKKGKKGSGSDPSPKWCSYHKTVTHSDNECKAQKEIQSLSARLALLQTPGHGGFAPVGSAHLAAAPQQPVSAASFAHVGSAHMAPLSSPTQNTFGYSFHAVSAAAAPPPCTGVITAGLAVAPAAPASAPAESPSNHRLPEGIFRALMATTPDLYGGGGLLTDGSVIRLLVDSGASYNFVDPELTPGLLALMRDYESLQVPHEIVAAGQHILHGVAAGTINGAIADDGGNKRDFSFRAIVVPGLGTNLFSVSQAMLGGMASLFYPDNPRLEKDDLVLPMKNLGVDEATRKTMCSIEVELEGREKGASVQSNGGAALTVVSADLWHRRMGHVNRNSMNVLRQTPCSGVDYNGDLTPCDVCPFGKSEQQPHPKRALYDVERPFELVTVDTMGPISPLALGGYAFVTKFVDQLTKWKEIFLIKSKTNTVDSLELFNKAVVIPSKERLVRLKGDKGTEFTSSEFRQYCLDIGIQLEFASTNTPQQIGANERAGRTLAGIVRCLLTDSGLPSFLWGELMQAAVYLSNRVPHAALSNGTPYKALYGKDAYLGNLRVIGARSFVHVETHTKKLEPRAWEGRLVGYSTDSKSYRIYNPATKRVRESRNVVFIETPSALPRLEVGGFDDGDFTYDEGDDLVRDVRDHTSNIDIHGPSPNIDAADPFVTTLIGQIHDVTNRDIGIGTAAPTPPISPGGVSPAEQGPPPSDASPSGASPSGSLPSGSASRGGSSRGGSASRGGRATTPAVTRATASTPNARTISELRRLNFAYSTMGEYQDVAHKDDMPRFAEYAYAVQTMQPGIPKSFYDAMKTPEASLWRAAADKEMDSLHELKVYKLVPRSTVPPGQKIINSKWVLKRKADNSYKARVVAQGWNQVHGLDCGNTFAPVCRLQSVRMVLAIAVEMDWEVIQLDVKTAFLYADIEEEVFVAQPPGYETKDKDGGPLVMRLEKSLYGLAQSPGNWFHTIDPVLKIIGFVPLKSDTCVYIYKHNGVTIILTLYVDDLLVIGGNIEVIEKIKTQLMDRFKMTDMGDVSRVLGLQVTRNRAEKTLTIDQEEYTKSALERFGFANCKPTLTPGYGPELSTKQPEETLLNAEETQRYQAIAGTVMYLSSVLRYDIMYSSSQLSRAMSNPSKVHMVAAKHILRYLAGSTNFTIVYKKGGFKLTAFSDANWANNPDNGKSTSCYIMMLARAPISFKSGLQSLTAMSTMEAELVASALAMKEAVFCMNMMTELGFGEQFVQVPLHCDNTATLHALGNRSFSSRTKHIALRYFYIRELVTEGKISTHYIPTNDNPADIGTKHFAKPRFQQLLDIIRNF